jgi:hypothetical protein
MILHPEIQIKAQAEFDKTVKGRLPGIQDENSLPYITAIPLKILCWGVNGSISQAEVNQFAVQLRTCHSYSCPSSPDARRSLSRLFTTRGINSACEPWVCSVVHLTGRGSLMTASFVGQCHAITQSIPIRTHSIPSGFTPALKWIRERFYSVSEEEVARGHLLGHTRLVHCG